MRISALECIETRNNAPCNLGILFVPIRAVSLLHLDFTANLLALVFFGVALAIASVAVHRDFFRLNGTLTKVTATLAVGCESAPMVLACRSTSGE